MPLQYCRAGKDGDLGAMGVEVPSRDPTNTYSWGPGRLEWFNNCQVLSAPVLWLLVASEG
jgi:hypothetical protein